MCERNHQDGKFDLTLEREFDKIYDFDITLNYSG